MKLGVPTLRAVGAQLLRVQCCPDVSSSCFIVNELKSAYLVPLYPFSCHEKNKNRLTSSRVKQLLDGTGPKKVRKFEGKLEEAIKIFFGVTSII